MYSKNSTLLSPEILPHNYVAPYSVSKLRQTIQTNCFLLSQPPQNYSETSLGWHSRSTEGKDESSPWKIRVLNNTFNPAKNLKQQREMIKISKGSNSCSLPHTYTSCPLPHVDPSINNSIFFSWGAYFMWVWHPQSTNKIIRPTFPKLC